MVHGPVREVVRGPGPLDWSMDRGSVFSGHPPPPFSLLRDFSFQNTSEHFAIRFRQSYLIWEKYDVTAIELSEGIRMAPNYPVNLRWRVIY